MERLILDTGVLIAVERRKVVLDHVLADDDDPVIAAIKAAELLQDVELADDIARAHARLLAHVRRAGRLRGAHDPIIAATALTTARTVVTYDKRACFDDLPGVRVRRL